MEMMKIAPWEVVDESTILGVKHPQTGEVYYAYVMGSLGEVVGFNLYDEENIAYWRHTFEQIQEHPESFNADFVLFQKFLQVAAVSKSKLNQEAKSLHTAAGTKVPRGKKGYTEAISYRPGYAPSLANEEDMELLSALIPGLINLIDDIDFGSDVDMLTETDEAFISTFENGDWTPIADFLPKPKAAIELAADVPLNPNFWQDLKALPNTDEDFAIRAGLTPAAVLNEEGESVFLACIVALGLDSKLILGFGQVFAPEWKDSAALELKDTIERTGHLPAAFVTGQSHYQTLIKSCASALGIPFRIDEAAARAELVS